MSHVHSFARRGWWVPSHADSQEVQDRRGRRRNLRRSCTFLPRAPWSCRLRRCRAERAQCEGMDTHVANTADVFLFGAHKSLPNVWGGGGRFSASEACAREITIRSKCRRNDAPRPARPHSRPSHRTDATDARGGAMWVWRCRSRRRVRDEQPARTGVPKPTGPGLVSRAVTAQICDAVRRG